MASPSSVEACGQSLFPLVSFDLVGNELADRMLEEWGHWLGGCNRPFGRQSFGLFLEGEGLVSVAVSASTVNGTCGGWPRGEVVELARLCSRPDQRWATRVCLRLWREVAPRTWGTKYWPVRACVSYANALRHKGDIYRFDGWRKVAETKGSTGGGGWSRPRKAGEPKTVWVWKLEEGE
ncbi:MAG: hypothetical protein JRN42_08820 [Nitrososphaerota archaeon]|nr:hypothetical protein [Nitrososphaerota archaeon]